MDIKQDPNAIPNFNSGGRLGEAQRNEPEQVQSSVELDPTAGGDGAASEAAEHESLLGDGGHRAGLGLGLYITRALAEREGGRLELAARPGGGLCATLHLPLSS